MACMTQSALLQCLFWKWKFVPTRLTYWEYDLNITQILCLLTSARNARWTLQKTTPAWTELCGNIQNAHTPRNPNLSLLYMFNSTPAYIWGCNFSPSLGQPSSHCFPITSKSNPSKATSTGKAKVFHKVNCHIYCSIYVFLSHLKYVKPGYCFY